MTLAFDAGFCELIDALPRFSREILHAAEINVSGEAGHH